MNLFVLDEDFQKNAAYHIDRHVSKIIIESAQVLSAAHWLTGSQAPYRLSHKNNPIIKWVLASKQNYQWALEYAKSLCSEYTFRYNKTHATEQVIRWLDDNRPNLPDIGLTPHYQAMPDHLRGDNAVEAYRQYYRECKRVDKAGRSMLSWKGRIKPAWFDV